MAGAVAGVGVGLGLSCSTTMTTTKLSQRRSSSSKTTSRCCVKMAVSLDEKKKNYTLQKSEEAFAAPRDLHMWDIDGNEYIDYVGSWGPAIIGHADDEVLAALAETMKKGTSFGAPCLLENVQKHAWVYSAWPVLSPARRGLSSLRAVTMAMPIHFLVKAGSGVATLGLPDSPGVPKGATYETLTAPFNDISAVENLFETNKGEIAGIILEPVVGNSVMTGFRLSYGGAQEYFGITPDLSTLGKVIGGGLPVGAYGGRKEIMEMVAPAGPMYQAGTLSGNPLAMTAGIHTLKRLQKPGTYEYLDKITGELVRGIVDAGKKAGHAMCGGYIRGMFGFFFTEGPVYNFEDAKKSDTAKFARFYRGMLEEGVYICSFTV
uniref:Glutamate-1-semialdehyde 2,1-aminomutase n=1 Tax=Fagus sylvatica TaxID=28930 RepID=A0A2N9EXZ3_FAGSY